MSRPYCDKHRKYREYRGGEFWRSCSDCNREEDPVLLDPYRNRDLKAMIHLETRVEQQLNRMGRYPDMLVYEERLEGRTSSALKQILEYKKSANNNRAFWVKESGFYTGD